MTRTLAAFLIIAFLTTLPGTASARAVNDLENRVGVFEPYPDIDTYAVDGQPVERHRGNTMVVYDPATGVLFYVRQNPWTKFDPLGLKTIEQYEVQKARTETAHRLERKHLKRELRHVGKNKRELALRHLAEQQEQQIASLDRSMRKIVEFAAFVDESAGMAIGSTDPLSINDADPLVKESLFWKGTAELSRAAAKEIALTYFTGGVGRLSIAIRANRASRAMATAPKSLGTRWGPHTGAGPLGEKVAGTFRGGSYTELATSEATTLYRAYGGKAGELGSYWSRVKPTGPLQSRVDSALLPQWGNAANKVSTIQVPKGTTIFEGVAAPQGNLLGGGSQVFIPEVNPAWLVK